MGTKINTFLKSVCKGIALVTLRLLFVSMIFGVGFTWAISFMAGHACYTDLLDLLNLSMDGAASNAPNNITLGVHNISEMSFNQTMCDSGEMKNFFFISILVIIGSLMFIAIFIALIISETEQIYHAHLPQYFTSMANIKRHKYTSHMGGSRKLTLPAQLVQATWKYDERLGKDSAGLSHSGIKVKQVLMVNSHMVLQQYIDSRMATTEQQVDLPDELQQNPVLTSVLETLQHDQKGDSEISLLQPSTDSSEVYLFHGTKLECIPSILKEGFDLNRARSGLYGKAIYLAESSEKADQYCDYPRNRRLTHLAMIIARVNLGRVFIHKEEGPVNLADRNSMTQYHTVIAGFNKRFREFLVLDQKNVYPEYVIIYDRC